MEQIQDQPIETWTVEVEADTRSLQRELRNASALGRQFSGALSRAFQGLAVKGKSLGEVFRGLALDLSRLVLKAAFKPLEQSLGNAFSGLFAGGFGFAKGGVLTRGTPTPFAKGGVIATPTLFPMAEGTGLMGERGAEAIMPLARGADGRLGVAVNGDGGGRSVVINITTPDVDGFRRSESQVAAIASRALSLGQRNM